MTAPAKEILCTLGPASLNDRVIGRLTELGVSLFRVNLSHTVLEDVARVVDFIQSRTRVPVCLDTEGAQIRTGHIVDSPFEARENTLIRIPRRRVPGDSRTFNLHPIDIPERFQVGDFLSIDFNAVLAQVVDFEEGAAVLRVVNGGMVGKNKAVTVERDIALPPMTEKDLQAVRIGKTLGVRHFALSFANRGSDVEQLREMVGPEAFVISKIESRSGLNNIEAIARHSDALLIDRGDLSREIPIERIPRAQKAIIRRAKEAGVKVYVATNLLESMVTAPIPTRAEVNDIYNTLMDGADGLVLAAETAIGKFPIHCASMVVKMIRELDNGNGDGDRLFHENPTSLLPTPHGGGSLTQREASAEDRAAIPMLPKIQVDERVLIDCDNIALGSYAPLTGFMNRETLESVLSRHRLPDGNVWPMPIVLAVHDNAARALRSGMRIALTGSDGAVHALLDVSEVYEPKLDGPARAWLAGNGNTFVAGGVRLVERPSSAYRKYELSPSQSRFVLARKGWSRVAGFATRNVCRRGDETTQLAILEEAGVDGLLISPIVGNDSAAPFLPGPVLKSYQLMIDYGIYPPGRVVLGSIPGFVRGGGARDAVFMALCQKNMGCSHAVIGLDQGSNDGAVAAKALFDSLGDIGIAPLFRDNPNPTTETDNRHGAVPADLRDFVRDMLLEEIAAGAPVFNRAATIGR